MEKRQTGTFDGGPGTNIVEIAIDKKQMGVHKPKKQAQIAPRVVLLICALALSSCSSAQNQPSLDTKPTLVVRISSDRHHFYPGENVHLRVEIWNETEKDMFVLKDITTTNNALAKIDLILNYKNQPVGPNFEVDADCFCSQRSTYPPLSSELPRYWIALAPHHFYGGEVALSLSWSKKPKVPGRYLIKGRYSSRGFLAQDINNPLLHYADELKQLPYDAWVGEVETNSVWIDITN